MTQLPTTPWISNGRYCWYIPNIAEHYTILTNMRSKAARTSGSVSLSSRSLSSWACSSSSSAWLFWRWLGNGGFLDVCRSVLPGLLVEMRPNCTFQGEKKEMREIALLQICGNVKMRIPYTQTTQTLHTGFISRSGFLQRKTYR